MLRFLFFSCVLSILGMPFSVWAAEPYTPEMLANLVKPSVVRIMTHTVGEAEIVPIKVDMKRGFIAVDEEGERKKVKIDEYISGSGLIIHPDGYIATNAHVVSEETIKHMLASDSALAAFYENALYLSDEEAQSFLQSGEAEAFGKRILRTVIENSRFDLESEVFVLDPRSEKEKAADLVKEAFPATVVSASETFLEDDRDVALMKIGLDRLPALPLSTENTLSVGSTAYIFGFPGTAELNTKSPLEATFTRGVVSALKTATGKNFPIYQTDAKVSQGSSGGPLFNDRGEVVGLVTFQTGELDRSSGDNFAFALPASLILDEATKIGLILDRHELFMALAHGMDAFRAKRCQEAFEYFHITEAANEVFALDKSVAPYRERCRSIQASGLALDTRWDMLRNSAENLGTPLLSLVGGAVFLVALFGAALFWLVRQVRREEEEIGVLRRLVRNDERRLLEKKYGNERITVHVNHTPIQKKSFRNNRER